MKIITKLFFCNRLQKNLENQPENFKFAKQLVTAAKFTVIFCSHCIFTIVIITDSVLYERTGKRSYHI